MFAFDLLHRQLPHCVLRGRKMPLVHTRRVGVISGDTKGSEQSLVITDYAWSAWEQALDTRLDAAYLPHHSISATSCRTHTYWKDL